MCYYWAYDYSVTAVCELTGRAESTVIDWFNLCRDIPVELFRRRDKMGGPDCMFQIDESLLRGKRKYNRGRFRGGEVILDQLDENDPNAANIINSRNHGRRISGPWVFGICYRTQHYDIDVVERRFFVVEKRDRATLIPIIQNEIEVGSTIHSDEWTAYSSLGRLGYLHETVNHQEYFVDPHSGANTQLIECLWKHAKLKIISKMNGTSRDLLHRHLAELWWRSLNPKDPFMAILRDIKLVFNS